MADAFIVAAGVIGVLVCIGALGYSLYKKNEDSSSSSTSKSKSKSKDSSSWQNHYSPHTRPWEVEPPSYVFKPFDEKLLHKHVENHDMLKSFSGMREKVVQIDKWRRAGAWKAPHHIIAYKATRRGVLQLLIPKGAIVVQSRNSKKHRTNKALPLGWFEGQADTAFEARPKVRWHDGSIHQRDFTYRAGELQREINLDTDPGTSCSRGIHFFANFKQAKDWWRKHGDSPLTRRPPRHQGSSPRPKNPFK